MSLFPSLKNDIEKYEKYYKSGWMSVNWKSVGEINADKENATSYLDRYGFIVEREDKITKDFEDKNWYMIYRTRNSESEPKINFLPPLIIHSAIDPVPPRAKIPFGDKMMTMKLKNWEDSLISDLSK